MVIKKGRFLSVLLAFLLLIGFLLCLPFIRQVSIYTASSIVSTSKPQPIELAQEFNQQSTSSNIALINTNSFTVATNIGRNEDTSGTQNRSDFTVASVEPYAPSNIQDSPTILATVKNNSAFPG